MEEEGTGDYKLLLLMDKVSSIISLIGFSLQQRVLSPVGIRDANRLFRDS